MRRGAAIAAAVLALSGILAAQAPATKSARPDPGKDSLFFSLKVNYSAMSWADFGMTTVGLNRLNLAEANPIARGYVEKPGAAVAILLLSDLSVHIYGDWLYKKNKTAAYIFMGALTLVRAYVLYENVRAIQRCAR